MANCLLGRFSIQAIVGVTWFNRAAGTADGVRLVVVELQKRCVAMNGSGEIGLNVYDWELERYLTKTEILKIMGVADARWQEVGF